MNKTLHEAWTGQKPYVGNFKTLYSLSFRHVPRKIRRKLDYRNQAMVTTSYNSSSAYKLYASKENKVVISRDVICDENRKWNQE